MRTDALETLFDEARHSLEAALQSGLLRDRLGSDPLTLARSLQLIAAHGLGVRTVHALHALGCPERIALRDPQQQLSFAQLDARINQLAHALHHRLGLQRGDRIAIMMPNRVDYILAWFAAFRAGLPLVHCSYRSTSDELDYLLEHSQARALLLAPSTLDTALETCAQRELPPALILCDPDHKSDESEEAKPSEALQDILRLDELIEGMPQDFFAPPRKQSQATSDNVVYTSGTTGKPKAAVRDWTSLGLFELVRVIERLPFRAGDRHLVVAPIYHSGAQVFVSLATSLACTIELAPHFDAEACLRQLHQQRIHHVFLVPTMIRRLLELPEQLHRRYPCADLRAIISGAAAFPHDLRRQAIARFGPDRLFDFYGATELGWITTINGHQMVARPGSVGQALRGQQIQIRDPDGKPLPPKEVGEIFVSEEMGMSGYLHDDEANHKLGLGQHWITVDDLGYLDEDGFLYLAGRARDMVICGGVNIYPAEIEEALLHHPAIHESAIIGLPHPEWGEELLAVVAWHPDHEPLPNTELEDFLRQRLSSYKIPRRWQSIDALPRNPTGKILKRELRQRFA